MTDHLQRAIFHGFHDELSGILSEMAGAAESNMQNTVAKAEIAEAIDEHVKGTPDNQKED